jgi:hypothetical protein
MPGYHYAHTPIATIGDQDLTDLFDEIANLRDIAIEGLVIQFLYQAFHPLSPDDRVKFDKKKFTSEYFLPMKIKKLQNSEIYKLCIDLARISRVISVEDIDGYTLYAFLNKTIADSKKPKKRTKRSWMGNRWM